MIPEWNKEGLKNTEEWVLISHDLNEIKSIMNDYVGIVRSNLRLERAHRRIELIYKEVVDYYNRTIITNALLELRNLVQVADLVIPLRHDAKRKSRHIILPTILKIVILLEKTQLL